MLRVGIPAVSAQACSMVMAIQGEITRLLVEARSGEPEALDRLFERVYQELRQTAHYQLVRRRPGETLSTTALVHEAYLKLSNSSRLQVQDRHHFFAVAARAMRQIILDCARNAQAGKRGGGAARVEIEPANLAARSSGVPAAELLALEDALTRLAVLSTRLAQVVELRFFAGLSVEETGEALALSPRTVKRDWQKARAFLYHTLDGAVAS